MYKIVDMRIILCNIVSMKVSSFLNKIEATDVLQLIGLSLLGVGLFVVYGTGWSCIVSGVACTLLGFFGQKGK